MAYYLTGSWIPINGDDRQTKCALGCGRTVFYPKSTEEEATVVCVPCYLETPTNIQ